MRVLLLGATGTIGRATAMELVRRSHAVVCPVRPGSDVAGLSPGVAIRAADPGEQFDSVICCLASRTGAPADAWAVDHRATVAAIAAAKAAGAGHFVLLSAICVQKPRLAFQHAKLAAEATLIASGLRWTIVRPTAFFKSLSGQVERVRRGKPFLAFGDGRLTACKPVSDRDLAAFLADCLENPARWNCVLPIGGPGPAITPVDQATTLGRLLGREVRVRHVPVRLLDAVVAMLGGLGRLVPALAAKAELAKIGRYYATESMLAVDPATDRYDAEATPETGGDRLIDHYGRLLHGEAVHDLGAQAVF